MSDDLIYKALREPLLKNKNATLLFKVSTGVTGLDEDGNSIVQTEKITFEAIIHPLKTEDGYFEGGDRKSLKVRGRLVDPLSFPNTIKHLQTGRATINGRSGDFTLYLMTQNPYTQSNLGDEFEGIFNEY